MRLRKDIKLAGSFDMSSVVYAQFTLRDTGQLWELNCVNDNYGNGYLKKI
jgi:hypothetical protein